MNAFDLGAVAMLCATLLIGLVLLARHQAAMRIASSETALLQAAVAEYGADLSKRLKTVEETFSKRLDDFDKRLMHVDNRTR